MASRSAMVPTLRSLVARVPGARAAARFLADRLAASDSDTRLLREAYAIGMTQKWGEIRGLITLVRELRPRRVLEIGTASGGTLYVWTRLAGDEATLISLDLPSDGTDEGAERAMLERWRRFARGVQRLHFLRMDSHSHAARQEVLRLLEGESLDFLFIDGDHSWEGVRRDVADYTPLVRPGGLVAFHDIHPHPKGWGGEVPRFWAEIRGQHAVVELVEDQGQEGFGIGVVRVERG